MSNKTVYPYGTEGQLPYNVGLVNDLVTGGANKALTAEQGRYIGDYFFGELTPINLAQYTLSHYSLGASSWSGNGQHIVVPVNPGERYVLRVERASGTAWYGYFKDTYTPPTATTDTIPYVSGTSRMSLAAGESNAREITVPARCYYICLCYKDGNGEPCIWTLFSRGANIGTLNNNLSIKVLTPVDLSTLTVNSNSMASNGQWSFGTQGACHLAVPVTPNTYIRMQCYDSTSSGNLYGFCNSTYTPPTAGTAVPYARGCIRMSQTDASGVVERYVPSGAYYLILVLKNGSAETSSWRVWTVSTKPVNQFAVGEEDTSEGSTLATQDVLDRLVQARYVASDPSVSALTLLHFTDIHGDSKAAVNILDFFSKNSSKINDMVNTGDSVYYYWNSSGQDYQWYKNQHLDRALFVLGNHDGASSESWDYKGKEWDFDTYFSDYISSRGVTPPTGYDDPESPYYKACYWHKDYASAKVRLIGLDCMHFNDGVLYTNNDQETWLTEKLQETLTSGNSAYGYSVVFLCHYPIDDYSGANEQWDDTTHKFIYNQKSNGGHVMDASTGRSVTFHSGDSYTAVARFCMRNKVGTPDDYSKGSNNPIAEIIQTWMNNGGKFIAWLSGHTHTEYMYYPTRYPNMLCVGLSQAGNTRGTNEGNRSDSSSMHTSANIIVIDTQNKLFKIIRLGKTLDKNLTAHVSLCYNYSTKTVYR